MGKNAKLHSLSRAVLIAILIATGVLSSTNISSADDQSDFLKLLRTNTNGSKCLNIQRMIRTSATLNFDYLWGYLVTYEAYCAFDTAEQYVEISREKTGDMLFGMITREWTRHYGGADKGIYGDWFNIIAYLRPNGLFENIQSPINKNGATEILGYLAFVCRPSGQDNMRDALHYLRTWGAQPDAVVEISKFNESGKPLPSGTPRQFLKQNCPSLTYIFER